VQVKSGNARGLQGQVVDTQATTGIRTVGYAPGIGAAAWDDAARNGVPIMRSMDELLAYLREFS